MGWGHSRHLQAWAPFWRTKRGPRRIYYSSVHHSLSLRVLWELLRLQGSPSPKVLPRPQQGHPKVLLEQPLAHLLLDPSFDPRTLEPTPSCGAFSLIQHRPRLGYPHPRPPYTTSSLQGPLHCCRHIRAWGSRSWGRNSCTLHLPSLGPHSYPRGRHCQVRGSRGGQGSRVGVPEVTVKDPITKGPPIAQGDLKGHWEVQYRSKASVVEISHKPYILSWGARRCFRVSEAMRVGEGLPKG